MKLQVYTRAATSLAFCAKQTLFFCLYLFMNMKRVMWGSVLQNVWFKMSLPSTIVFFWVAIAYLQRPLLNIFAQRSAAQCGPNETEHFLPNNIKLGRLAPVSFQHANCWQSIAFFAQTRANRFSFMWRRLLPQVSWLIAMKRYPQIPFFQSSVDSVLHQCHFSSVRLCV